LYRYNKIGGASLRHRSRQCPPPLLARRDLTLTSIAERLGFSSLSYFSRYVRSRLGITPSEYRSGRF